MEESEGQGRERSEGSWGSTGNEGEETWRVQRVAKSRVQSDVHGYFPPQLYIKRESGELVIASATQRLHLHIFRA